MIWFVTDVRSGKEHEIEAEHDVCLVFIDAAAKAYLSITARAEVRHDHAKAAEICGGGSAGMPCPSCNLSSPENPPRLPEGFQRDESLGDG